MSEVQILPQPVPAGSRFGRNDARFVLLTLLLAVVSLAVALHFFHRAFPQANIDFRTTNSGARQIARNYLAAQHQAPPAGYRNAGQFGWDEHAQIFLERELGVAAEAQLNKTRIHLWRWEERWFEPLQKEEFRVAVTPDGQVVGFRHLLPEAAPGAQLDQTAAEKLAVDFLHARNLHPEAMTFIRGVRHVRPARTDYVFEWADNTPLSSTVHNAALAQANYRYEVWVQGNVVGGYREYLHIPDFWLRSYQHMRSKNETTGEVDTVLMLLLIVAGIIVLVSRIPRGDVHWRPARWVGLIGGLLGFLTQLNSLGSATYGYDTNSSYPAFLARGIFMALLAGVGIGALLALITAFAEPLYREHFKSHLALPSLLSWRAWRTRSTFRSLLLGLGLACFFFAYQSVFYVIANHFGAWAPADVSYDQLLNSRWPWLFVLFMGFFPAISEEFVFRMFAIPFFAKYLRWMPLAVVLASFLWGFGHATYPNEPFYIRGLEVGLGGIILSVIMIRFGILTTLVWHYTVDALYTAMLLLTSHSLYFRVSGGLTAFITLIPLAACIVAYRRHGGFAEEAGLRNEDVGTAPPLNSEAAEAASIIALPSYQRVPRKVWLGAAVVALALLASFALRVPGWRVMRPGVTPAQAAAQTSAFLTSHGVNLRGYKVVVSSGSALTPNPLLPGDNAQRHVTAVAAHALFRAQGAQAVHNALTGRTPITYWRVRYFKPDQKQEYVVRLRPSGNGIVGLHHIVRDDAPAASPTQSQAIALASAFLTRIGYNPAGMTLKEAEQLRRPARMDTSLLWQAPPDPQLAPADFRLQALLQGTEVSQFRPLLHVPETMVRRADRRTVFSILPGFFDLATMLALAVLVLTLFYEAVRRREGEAYTAVPWKAVFLVASATGLLDAIAAVDRFKQVEMARYTTNYAWSLWQTTSVISIPVSFLAGLLPMALLLPPLLRVAPRVRELASPLARRLWARDAFWASLAALATAAGFEHLLRVCSEHFHRVGAFPLPSLDAYTGLVPGMGDTALAISHAILLSALFGILAAWLGGQLKAGRGWLLALAVVAFAVAQLPATHSAAAFAFNFALGLATWILVAAFTWFLLRGNPLSYLSAAVVIALAGAAAPLLEAPLRYYRIPGLIVVPLGVVWLAWVWLQGAGAVRGTGN